MLEYFEKDETLKDDLEILKTFISLPEDKKMKMVKEAIICFLENNPWDVFNERSKVTLLYKNYSDYYQSDVEKLNKINKSFRRKTFTFKEDDGSFKMAGHNEIYFEMMPFLMYGGMCIVLWANLKELQQLVKARKLENRNNRCICM
jgi:hypothetical protein